MSAILMLCWTFKLIEDHAAINIWIAAAVCNAILAGIVEYWERAVRKIAIKLSKEDVP